MAQRRQQLVKAAIVLLALCVTLAVAKKDEVAVEALSTQEIEEQLQVHKQLGLHGLYPC